MIPYFSIRCGLVSMKLPRLIEKLLNLQLLHRHCHDRKTARETGSRGADDKRRVVEEPDEGKRVHSQNVTFS
jgi:5-methylcytosine-specific restriction endonuclease McrA